MPTSLRALLRLSLKRILSLYLSPSGITKAVGNASLPERPVKRAPAGRVEHAGDTSNLIPEEGYLLLSFDQKRVGFIPNITSLSKKEAVFVTFL